MLVLLAAMALGVVGGGGIMVLDGFVGIGVGWAWYFGVAGLVAIGLCAQAIRIYVTTMRRTAR